MNKITLLTFAFVFFLVGCSHIPTPKERKQTITSLINNSSYTTKTFQSNDFNIFGIISTQNSCENKTIHIYIEGDGLAWITRSRVSDDPTPTNPLGLKLMLKDPNTCKIYLARPCQYIDSNKCEKKYWSSARFHKKVIDSYNEVLNTIKTLYQNDTFELVGYSGGGAVATLLSAQRDDISRLVTIAGNLDTEKWTKIHNISPLYDSLNPADFTKELEKIPQLHLIGGKDTIIPFSIFNSYKSKFQNNENIHYKIYDDYTHSKGWIEE